MTDVSGELVFRRGKKVGKAVYQNRPLSKAGLSERFFALLFSGLVYPQIWEDPEVDMEAMQLGEGHRVVTIASGGCNILAYLTRSPVRIDAVDLNAAHIALNRMKLAAVRHLPSQADLFRFFGEAGVEHNSHAYDRFIAPNLDATSRSYWERRNWRGRRRIATFDANFYKTGLLGLFIAAGHGVARLYGVDPAGIMSSRTREEQRRFFDERIAPVFERRMLRWVTSRRSSLFGLGIPPAQYDSLLTSGDGSMAGVLKDRLEKLACDFPLANNYFAWQAFARRYPRPGEAELPAYLDQANYATIRDNVGRVAIHHANFTEHLAAREAASVDRFVLLDAQDWMSDLQLNALWAEITRTAAPEARVIFRTAAEPSLLPGRLSPALLDQWSYDEANSRDFTARDRSAIYGGFHLYVKKPA
ncbi:MAG: S-adenosylmethionine--diacylglycerol 3-amino-3-carboxypropyl transferase [Mesorhizobium sp. SCN 65-20]|nr:MAG: S-adenosylmethionine--diacylglycerol 3-amino-3-carboxypropyl transferase [Mesorhizobium sp. SCN 65-20]